MYIDTTDDDQISLTLREFQALTALADGPATAYTVRQTTNTGYSTVHAALRRLERLRLVQKLIPDRPRARNATAYAITEAGRTVLGWQAANLAGLAALAQDRLSAAAAPAR